MLSEGRPRLDNIISLEQGMLRLEVDKATYERMGLQGKPISNGGRKHVKVRYAIELNLRLPSMVRGKHGFDRIVWAFTNVLDRRLAWLFYDCKGPNDGSGPIAAYQPQIKMAPAEIEQLGSIVVPAMPDNMELGDNTSELLEWLGLVAKKSPRVKQDDQIDPYLSRYEAPSLNGDVQATNHNLVKLQWHGLVPASFIQSIFIAVLKSTADPWFAMTTKGFSGKTHTFIQNKQHTLTLEFED